MPQITMGALAWLSMTSVLTLVQAVAIPVSSPDLETRATTGKRGLPYNSGPLANLYNSYSQITWGYNWGYPANGLST